MRKYLPLLVLLVLSCRERTFIPPAPDYSDPVMWYTRMQDTTSTGADIFYVVSTWEADWKDAEGRLCHYADVWKREHRDRMAIEISKVAGYMGPGNNFYSPYYRHMAIDTWVTGDEDLIHERTRLSMDDVKTAFDEFLRVRGPGRPFVIAGFSQGGLAVVELLKHMDDDTYRDLVAAYVLGYKVTPADTLATRHIRAAQGADDLGVTICYNTVKDVKYIQPVVSGDCVMCINPVNWRTDATPAVLHDTITVSVSPEHHVLVVEGYDGAEYKPIRGVLNVGDIHSCEPWLYSDQLAGNFALRIKEWRNRQQPCSM